ncbi:MAG: hypothetical protein ACFFC7_23810 [Candidatus Hermodarchaeota archaeon]
MEYQRLARRNPGKVALIALARKLLVIAYTPANMLYACEHLPNNNTSSRKLGQFHVRILA